MSAWNEALDEFKKESSQQQVPGGKPAWAKILDKRIKLVSDHSGRPLAIYATACTSSRQVPAGGLQIDFSDKVGFHEVTHNISGKSLDLLIHSPGGSPEAAESIVELLRAKYENVRIIVPSYAKSAATMLAMSADEIYLCRDSELGPIDPQMPTANGFSPAEAIKEQFAKANAEVSADPKKLSVWIPILQQMGPSMLVQCDNAITLSKTLVRQWLSRFMFAGQVDADSKAGAVADYLSQHSNFKSHGRCIRKSDLVSRGFGLNLTNIDADPTLDNKIWSLYCAIDVIFGVTGIFKLFMNSKDKALVRAQNLQPIMQGTVVKQKP